MALHGRLALLGAAPRRERLLTASAWRGCVRVLEIPRSTVYAARTRRLAPAPPRKRGPRTAFTDAELTEQIRAGLARSPFVGEGYRKVWARLRLAEVRAGKPRVLWLMREANLLAPARTGQPHGPAAHDGTIIPGRPDAMWGIDATAGWTDEGLATVFVAVSECIDIHATERGTRFEALEPLRQGIRRHFDGHREGVAAGRASTSLDEVTGAPPVSLYDRGLHWALLTVDRDRLQPVLLILGSPLTASVEWAPYFGAIVLVLQVVAVGRGYLFADVVGLGRGCRPDRVRVAPGVPRDHPRPGRGRDHLALRHAARAGHGRSYCSLQRVRSHCKARESWLGPVSRPW